MSGAVVVIKSVCLIEIVRWVPPLYILLRFFIVNHTAALLPCIVMSTDQIRPQQTMDTSHIPMIDFSQWRSSDPANRQRCVDQVYEACTKSGFFYIKVSGKNPHRFDHCEPLEPTIPCRITAFHKKLSTRSTPPRLGCLQCQSQSRWNAT